MIDIAVVAQYQTLIRMKLLLFLYGMTVLLLYICGFSQIHSYLTSKHGVYSL